MTEGLVRDTVAMKFVPLSAAGRSNRGCWMEKPENEFRPAIKHQNLSSFDMDSETWEYFCAGGVANLSVQSPY